MIHPYAECDNCGELARADSGSVEPEGWGLLGIRPHAGSDAIRLTLLLCPACVAVVDRALLTSKERTDVRL